MFVSTERPGEDCRLLLVNHLDTTRNWLVVDSSLVDATLNPGNLFGQVAGIITGNDQDNVSLIVLPAPEGPIFGTSLGISSVRGITQDLISGLCCHSSFEGIVLKLICIFS